MKAYSEDVRACILGVVDAGMSKRHAAQVFGVSRSTIKRAAQQRRETGNLVPKSRPPRRVLIGDDQHEALRAQLDAAPDATLAAHCATWAAQQGVGVSVATMHRAIARLAWARKKDPCRQRARRGCPHRVEGRGDGARSGHVRLR